MWQLTVSRDAGSAAVQPWPPQAATTKNGIRTSYIYYTSLRLIPKPGGITKPSNGEFVR